MGGWAAVIGDPVRHSLSPVLHNAAYQYLGLDWDYNARLVTEESLPEFMHNLDAGFKGLSVTSPLKREILEQVNVVDGLAKLVGVANTVVPGGGLLAAFNTDVHGIMETVKPVAWPTEAALNDGPPVVIGTGATAASTLAALASLGHRRVLLLGRHFGGAANAFAAAPTLDLEVEPILLSQVDRAQDAITGAPLTISTVPPEATGDLAVGLEVREGASVLDVTYGQGESPLNAAFSSAGATVLSPLTMLVYQGLAQVKLMTNQEVPFDAVQGAVFEAASRLGA